MLFMNPKIIAAIIVVAISIGAVAVLTSQENTTPQIEDTEQPNQKPGKVISVNITERLASGD